MSQENNPESTTSNSTSSATPAEPNPAAVTPEPVAATSGLPPNIAAGLACLFSLLGGVVFLILEKKNSFVRFYAMQSVFLGGIGLAYSIGSRIFTEILRHIPFIGFMLIIVLGLVGLVVGLGSLVLWIATMIQAFSGKEWEIPYVGPLARKQLASMKS